MKSTSSLLAIVTMLLAILAVTSKIHQVTDSNFESFINSNELVFLKVFAPWCQISQTANKPFKELSDQFANSRIVFAEIDGDKNPKIVDFLKMQGFPGLFAFVNGLSNQLQYFGPVDQSNAMESFLTELTLKRDMPEYQEERVAEIKKGENYVGYGLYCGERESPEYIKIAHSAMQISNLLIFFTDSPSICSKFSITKGQLAYERISGAKVYLKAIGEADVLKRQLRFIKFDAVNPFIVDFFSDAIEGKFPMMIYIDENNSADHISKLQELQRRRLAYNMLVMHNKLQSDFETEYFPLLGVNKTQLPALLILIFNQKFIKYIYEGDWSPESLDTFVSDFYAKKLTPHLASEEHEPAHEGTLLSLTAKTMYKFLFDQEKFKVLLFYSPSCNGCDRIKQLVRDLAHVFEYRNDISFGKIDISKNEVPSIGEAPMLAFFTKEPEKEPLFYKGPVEFEKIKEFILEKAKDQSITSDL